MEKNEKIDRNDSLMAYFPENNGTFIVELKFTKDNNETAAKLLRSAVRGEEFMPDLVVNKLFRGIETIDTVTNIKKRDILNETINSLNVFMDNLKNELINFKLEEVKPSEYGAEYVGRS